jgi:hypothetical protein
VYLLVNNDVARNVTGTQSAISMDRAARPDSQSCVILQSKQAHNSFALSARKAVVQKNFCLFRFAWQSVLSDGLVELVYECTIAVVWAIPHRTTSLLPAIYRRVMVDVSRRPTSNPALVEQPQ